MPTGNPYYIYLLRRFMEETCTPEEQAELFALLQHEGSDLEWEESIQALLSEEPTDTNYDKTYWEPVIRKIVGRGRVRQMVWWKVAVAVCLLVVGWWFLVRGPGSGVGSEVGGPGTEVVKHDVEAPDMNKARVTLSDGRTVSLDSLQNGLLADQSGVKLIKLSDGRIIYQSAESNSPSPLVENGLGDEVNTLINPRGSRVIDLTLSDGSHVWLNAGSSITYPVSFVPFVGNRKVEISGEAYFEIAHDKTKPFIVSTMPPSGGRGAEVEVLGTHFNVNAYDDEQDIKVTLLEGSVKVSTDDGRRSTVIRPGEQARVTDNGQLATDSRVDLEQVMAWKNNKFIFSGDNIQSIMRQLARWYDVTVQYEGAVPTDEFVGVISRSRYENMSAILDMLARTKTVRFRMEGRTITVQKTN